MKATTERPPSFWRDPDLFWQKRYLDKIHTLSLMHPIIRIGQLKILKLGMA